MDAVAGVGGWWRAEPHSVARTGGGDRRCAPRQGGKQTGSSSALRALQTQRSPEVPKFHPVVRATGKETPGRMAVSSIWCVSFVPLRYIDDFAIMHLSRAFLEGASGLVCGFRRDYEMITYRIRDKIISFVYTCWRDFIFLVYSLIYERFCR